MHGACSSCSCKAEGDLSFLPPMVAAAVRQLTETERAPARVARCQGARSKIWNAKPPVPWSSKTLQLDATDIDGAQVGWRPYHRKHIGVVTNDTILNVADINRKPVIPHHEPRPEARPLPVFPCRTCTQKQSDRVHGSPSSHSAYHATPLAPLLAG